MTDNHPPRGSRRPGRVSAALLTASVAAIMVLATGSTQAATVTVAAMNYQFQPATRTIAVGDVVRWTFAGDPHSVTSRDGLFDSGVTDPGGSYQFKFTSPGTYRYFCQVHPEQMFGTIVVKDGSATPEPTVGPTPKPTPKPTVRPTPTRTPSPSPSPSPKPTPAPTLRASGSPSPSPAPTEPAVPSESPAASLAQIETPGASSAPSPGPLPPSPASAADSTPIALAAILLVVLVAGGLFVARRRRAL